MYYYFIRTQDGAIFRFSTLDSTTEKLGRDGRWGYLVLDIKLLEKSGRFNSFRAGE